MTSLTDGPGPFGCQGPVGEVLGPERSRTIGLTVVSGPVPLTCRHVSAMRGLVPSQDLYGRGPFSLS